MNTKQFATVLRKIIREEVREAVRAEFQLLREQRSPTLTKTKTVLRPTATQSTTPPVKKFGGPAGDILNETLHSMMRNPSLSIPDNVSPMVQVDPGSEEEWPEIGSGTFTSAMLGENEADGFQEVAPEAPSISMGMESNDPTMVFVKDYRATLQRAEQLSNERRP